MSTEIAIIDNLTDEEIMRLSGQDDNPNARTDSGLPRLKINRDPENDDGLTLPVGAFFVPDADGVFVYAKEALFRPFLSYLQYQTYDPVTEKYTCKSIIIKNFGEEAIDTEGGIRCGKLTRKQLDGLSQDDLAIQRNIRCYRMLYGTISMKGVTADGTARTIKDYPVLWRATGSAFMPIGDAITTFKDNKKLMHQHLMHLSLKREKKGSNVYYVPVIVADVKNTSVLKETNSLFAGFLGIVQAENNYVADKYRKATTAVVHTATANSVMQELGRDFDDPVGEL